MENFTIVKYDTLEQIFAVDLNRVPVVSTDRHISRKEQAKLARELFKKLGIKGLSVTTPNYSMASVVEVKVPTYRLEPGDYVLEGEDYENRSYSDMPEDVPAKRKHLKHWNAVKKIDAILLRAFPQHDDRSDLQSDYHDNCWSVN